MADQNMPNEASRKSKAEGERWGPASEHASDMNEDESSLSTDEGMRSQEPPRRGEPGTDAHAGDGDRDSSASKEDR